MLAYSIRQATQRDCEAIARLTTQLGYPVSAEEMQIRLQKILASEADCVSVAETSDAKLVGWIHGTLSQFLEANYRVEIAGIVVDENFQRHGIGHALLAHVEDWAVKHGAVHSTVRCRDTRPNAHRFYAKQGYGRIKTQIVFRKDLATETTDQ